MSRIINALMDRRWLVWTFLLLVSSIAIFGVSRLEFSEESRLLGHGDDLPSKEFQELSDAFRLDVPEAVLVVQAEQIFSKETIAPLHDLVHEVEQVNRVARTRSLLDVPRFKAPQHLSDQPLLAWLASLIPRSLVPPPEADEHAIADARETALTHPAAEGLLLSRDGRTTIIVAELDVPSGANDLAREVVRRLQRLAERYTDTTPVRVRVTGVAPIQVEILENLQSETRRILVLAVLAALGVAVVLFRQLIPALVAGGGALLGVLWTLGALGLAGQPLDLVNNVLPTLILVIGFTDAVHLIMEFRRSREQGESLSSAATFSIKRVGRACALTSLTTAVGFGSLAVADADVIRQFGVAAAGGAVLVFLGVVTSVPLVCSSRLGRHIGQRRGRSAPTERLDRWMRRIGVMAAEWRRTIAVGGLLSALLLGSTALKLQPSNQLTDALPVDTAAHQALRQVDQHLSGILDAQVVVEWPPELDALSPEVLSATRAIHQAVLEEGIRPWSLLTILNALPIVYRVLLLQLDAPETLLEEFGQRVLQSERRQALVHIRLPDWGTDEHAELFAHLRGRLKEIEQNHSKVRLRLTGRTVLASENLSRVMQDLGSSVGLAAVLISVVMAVGFRSLRLGLISALPNLFPLAVVAAVVYFSGAVVTLTALMVFSVCLGIATDDTIHLLNGFRNQPPEQDLDSAVIDALRRVGPALATSTIVLLAGFGTATLSSIPTTQSFARLASIAIVTALLADLVLLPALLAWWGPSRGDR